MHAKAWLIDVRSSACILTGSVNSTTNGLRNNYELLVKMKGTYIAKQFAEAFEECWNHVCTSIVDMRTLDALIMQAAIKRQARSGAAGSVQFRSPSAVEPSQEELGDEGDAAMPRRMKFK